MSQEGERSLLIWLLFSFKWWNKAFQMKKNNFLWITRKCSVLVINMWGIKFMMSATNYFINLLFPCEKSSNRLDIYFHSFCGFICGLGSAGWRVGPDSLRGLFHLKLFYDFMICNSHVIFLDSCCRGTKKNHCHWHLL